MTSSNYQENMNGKPPHSRIFFDLNKCTGCRVCELVCSFVHYNEFNPSLARIHIFNDLFTGKNRASICQQCIQASCIEACPVDAIYIDETTNALIIDSEKCVACGQCAKACPWNEGNYVIKHDEKRNLFIKCDLCGGHPHCVEWCAPKALTYDRGGASG